MFTSASLSYLKFTSRYNPYYYFYNEVKKIDWCGGMAVAIPVEVFKKIGGCDNINFPQYDGDTDFFLRAKKAGFNFKLLLKSKT